MAMNDILQEVERHKYERVWSDRGYASQADGEPVVDLAFGLMGCKPGESLIDWGCGCGRPAAKLKAKGLQVTGLDIAYNCLDPDIRITFKRKCLWGPLPSEIHADYAFSTDVLEHIPPNKLDLVLRNIYERTRKAAFIQVCTTLDISGPRMKPPERLHLSVMPKTDWWNKLLEYWTRVDDVGVGGKARCAFVCFKEV